MKTNPNGKQMKILAPLFFLSFSYPALAAPPAGGTVPTAAGAVGNSTAACINPGQSISTLKDQYKTHAFQYNGVLALLKTPLIKSAQDKTKSAHEQLKAVVPDIKSGEEGIDKLLYRNNGDERRIIDWVAMGGKLEDVMMDVHPKLKAVIPLLDRMIDRNQGLLAVTEKLGALRFAVDQLKPLPATLKDCNDWKTLHSEFPRILRAGRDAQNLLNTLLPLLTALDAKSNTIENLLKEGLEAAKKGEKRAENILGDNKDKTERRVAAVFIPLSPVIYTVELIKELTIRPDRMREFAEVRNRDWKLTRMNSNIIDLAAATRKAVFPPLRQIKTSLEDAKTSFAEAEPKIAPAITDLTNVNNSLTAVLNNLAGITLPPAQACMDCWFD